MRLLGRLILLTVGLAMAIPFGFLALLVGVTLDPAARDLLGSLGLAGVEAIVSDLAEGGPAGAESLSLLVEFWAGFMTLVVAPPAFAALVGEVAGWRSFAWYGAAAGALAAALPWLSSSRVAEAALPAEGRITALLFLAGAVSGLAYWLLAGRSAGRADGVRP
jgi:hypothetical protein